MNREQTYEEVTKRLDALCEGETNEITLMATIACELFHAFEEFHWVGFYLATGNRTLKVGPYQGGHGCLTIPYDQGVCGKCAREEKIQNVPDVEALPYHIACSSSTRSELVLPVFKEGELIAVLDIDSDEPGLFDETDEQKLEKLLAVFES